MIVEFLGLPATGKTSLAKEYIKLQKRKDINIEYPLENLYKKPWFTRNINKMSSFVKYILNNPKKSMLALHTIIRLEQETWKDIVKVYFNYIFLVSQYNRCSKQDQIYIFDEGIVHTIWSIIFKAKKQIRKDQLEILLDNIKLCKNIVRVEVEETLIEKRLYTRKSGTRLEKEEDVISAIKKSKDQINNILKIIQEDLKYNINIIEVRNDCEEDLKKSALLIEYKLDFERN